MSSTDGDTHKRGTVDRQVLLARAVTMADQHGLDKLSMRTLAKELGVGAMSLYYYVANKDDLLDAMVEAVAQEINAVPQRPSGEWKSDIRAIAIHAHNVLLNHAWVNVLWSSRAPGAAKLTYYETILRLFREAGFSVALSCRGFHAVTDHVVGFTLQKLDFPYEDQDIPNAARSFLQQMSVADYPFFAEHVRHHVDEPDADNYFVFMLDLILDGLERQKRGENAH